MSSPSDAEEQTLHTNSHISSPTSSGSSPRARALHLSKRPFTPSKKRSLGQFSPSSPGFKLAFADASQYSPPVQRDHNEDLEEGDEFQDALGGSPEVQAGTASSSYATETSSTACDEAEFQRLAADRSSRYSAATHFDAEGDEAGSGLGGGGSREDAEHLTLEPGRETSVGCSAWEARTVSANNGSKDGRRSGSDSGKAGRHAPLRTLPPPSSPLNSSFALQQLRETTIREEPTPDRLAAEHAGSARSSLLNSAYNSPNLTEHAEERFDIPKSVSIENEEFDIINPLRSNIASVYDRRVVDESSSATMTRSSSSPRVLMAHEKANLSPSTLQNGSHFGEPSAPSPVGTSAFQRRQRPPVLSFDGAVADEEALLNLAASSAASSSSGDPEQAAVTRRLSTLGPRLRKNEPAPWELEEGDDLLAQSHSVVSTALHPPHSPGAFLDSFPAPSSPWSKLTRGSLEQSRGDTRVKSGPGLSVRLRRPSGEVNSLSAFDGDTRRRAASASGSGLPLGPQAKTKFGSKPWSTESDGGVSPLFTGWTTPEFLARPRQGSKASSGSVGLKSPHQLRIDSGSSTSEVPLGMPDVVQVSSTTSTASANSNATPSSANQPKKTSSAGKVLKGLGLGGSATGSGRREGSGTGSDGDGFGAKQVRINNIKLVKSLKKKGERDELSLERGISSEGYAKAIEEEEKARANLLKGTQVPPARSQSPALSSRRPSIESMNTTAWRAAEANRGLVNPFTKLPPVSEPLSESSKVIPTPPVTPATPNRTTSRRKSVEHAQVRSTSANDIDADTEGQAQTQTDTTWRQQADALPRQASDLEQSMPTDVSTTTDPLLEEAPGVESGYTGSGHSDAVLMGAPSFPANACPSTTSATTPTSQDPLPFEVEDAAVGSAGLTASPRHQRKFSLLSNSSTMTSGSSVATGKVGDNSSLLFAFREGTSSPVPRGIGVGYKKSSGVGSPSLGTAQLPLRSPASNHFSARSVAESMGNPAQDDITSRSAAMQGESVHQPSTPSSTKSDLNIIDSKVGPGGGAPNPINGTELSTPSSEDSSGVHLESHTGDSTDTSTLETAVSFGAPVVSSRGTTLPIPGSHEGVAYKLISLEQAQAQRVGKDLDCGPLFDPQTAPLRSTAVERAYPSKAPQLSLSPDPVTLDQQHHTTGESMPAGYLHASGGHAARALKNKKSGLLKIFGRKQASETSTHDPDRQQEVSPAMPSLLRGMTTRDASAANAVDDLPSPLPSSTESIFLLPADEASGDMVRGDSVPALGALRPMSSIFVSLSPVLAGGNLPMETLSGEDEEEPPIDEDGAVRSMKNGVKGPPAYAAVSAGVRPVRPLRPDGFGGLTASFTARSGELLYDRDLTPTPITAARSSSQADNSTAAPLLGQTLLTPMTSEGISGLHSPWTSPLPPEVEQYTEPSPTQAWPPAGRSDAEPFRREGAGTPHSSSPSSRFKQGWQETLSATDRAAVASSIGSHSFTLANSATHPTDQASPSLLGSLPIGPASQGAQAQLRDRIRVIESRMSELAAELNHLRSMSLPPELTPPSPDATRDTHPESDIGHGAAASAVPPCAACGCTCGVTKPLQPSNKMEAVLLRPESRSVSGSSTASPSGASLMDRGRAVKKRAEAVAGRFGGGP